MSLRQVEALTMIARDLAMKMDDTEDEYLHRGGKNGG